MRVFCAPYAAKRLGRHSSRCGENAVSVRKVSGWLVNCRLNIALNDRTVQTASRGKPVALTPRVPLTVSALGAIRRRPRRCCRSSRWEATYWPRFFDRHQAITALTVTELLEGGRGSNDPAVAALREDCGGRRLTSPTPFSPRLGRPGQVPTGVKPSYGEFGKKPALPPAYRLGVTALGPLGFAFMVFSGGARR